MRHTSLEMNVHLFRHFAAYLYLKANPGHYEPVRHLLAHKDIATDKSTNEPIDALWVSRDGTALTQGPLRVAIYKRTEQEFGVRIPPHWFRDAAVTTLIRDKPESAKLTGAILGHTDHTIVQKHYNQSQMIDASRRHYQTICDLLEAAKTATAA
jgi:integrase